MKPHIASLINAISLIVLSLWAYFASTSPSLTALIPTVVGVILLCCNRGLKKQNKVIAHVVVVLTFLIIIGLIRPLMGALNENKILGIFRVGLMILSSVVALITFINSFIKARRGL
ncbi:MAG: hypothetical protein OXE77_04250 [Flavobacteriaceae bacterium]|nr:hypothetical protein [Flavobacteriaceae bacterium]MCY4266560.1 hypothetical protein [Flavobacteriaceae bacterium]MCY4300005.1 hypothetical protein [Flavobacteriaceae bacterium]